MPSPAFVALPACPERGTAFLESDSYGDRTVWFEDMRPHGRDGAQVPGAWLVVTARGVRLVPRTTGWTSDPRVWPELSAMFAAEVEAKAAAAKAKPAPVVEWAGW